MKRQITKSMTTFHKCLTSFTKSFMVSLVVLVWPEVPQPPRNRSLAGHGIVEVQAARHGVDHMTGQ